MSMVIIPSGRPLIMFWIGIFMPEPTIGCIKGSSTWGEGLVGSTRSINFGPPSGWICCTMLVFGTYRWGKVGGSEISWIKVALVSWGFSKIGGVSGFFVGFADTEVTIIPATRNKTSNCLTAYFWIMGSSFFFLLDHKILPLKQVN